MKKTVITFLTAILLMSGLVVNSTTQVEAKTYRVKIPNYNQVRYGYVNGCEGFSLYMALRGKGYVKNMGVKAFMKTMPRHSSNPNYGFVGDPTKGWNAKVNRGKRTTIFPAPVTKWGNKYGNCQNITGYSYSKIKKELRKGNPIVIWVTYKWAKPVWRKYSWGKAVTNVHIVCLVGYNSSNNKWLINDPYNGREYWITQGTMNKTWFSRKYAVVVRNKAYLNMTNITMQVGETYPTAINLVNANGDTFTSSDATIVSVTKDSSAGKITAKKPGTTTIYTTYNGVKYSCKVTVTGVPVLDKTNLTLEEGQTSTIDLKNVTGETFKSLNTAIATVDNTGKITAKKAGTTTIQSTYKGKTYSCKLTVNPKPVLNHTALTLKVGESNQLDLLNATGETFKSGNTGIATVDSTGKITAVKEGKTTITATYKTKTYTCQVTVEKAQETENTEVKDNE